MKITYPAYFETFRCIAGACPDSCCKEWAVDVDPKAAAYYRGLPGDLGDRLRQVLVDTEDGTIMEIEAGRCPMWRQDGLCRIQAELGHDALCKTCREFPRLRHDYGTFAELDLELSCPEAARLILSGASDAPCTQEAPGGEAPDYDAECMQILLESRTQTLEFLKGETYELPQSLAILLLYAHGVQAQLDGGEGETLAPAPLLAEARRYAAQGDLEAILAFFRDLEILTPTWSQRLQTPAGTPCWDPRLRTVATYMIRRYWLQAVSDYDLICRAKLIVTACILIAALGGDLLQTAQQFSKEIENDPDNIEAILDGAYTASALTDTNLLSLLVPEHTAP